MKKQIYSFLIIGLAIFLCLPLIAQDLQIVSWNAKDFGKSRDDVEMEAIANMLKEYDLIAIQEVVAKDPGGVQAVARLQDALSRKGAAWDYTYSDPTQSPSSHVSERYAFLWKKHKVKLKGRAYLLSAVQDVVHREPFVANFSLGEKAITIINYHSRTFKGNGEEEKEIEKITNWIQTEQLDNVIWAGDFNLEVTHSAFDKLKTLGFNSILHGEKTSLKKTCKNGNYLSSAEDNIFYRFKSINATHGGVLDFIKAYQCTAVSWLRNSFSDHLPVVIRIK